MPDKDEMTADEVRDWLLGGGKIFKDKGDGGRPLYRMAGANVPPEPPPPRVPGSVFDEYDRNGWLEGLADGTMFLINERGREALQ